MNHLERAKYWEAESEEWLSFVENTELTLREFLSAWGYVKRCDKYAENNMNLHRKQQMFL